MWLQPLNHLNSQDRRLSRVTFMERWRTSHRDTLSGYFRSACRRGRTHGSVVSPLCARARPGESRQSSRVGTRRSRFAGAPRGIRTRAAVARVPRDASDGRAERVDSSPLSQVSLSDATLRKCVRGACMWPKRRRRRFLSSTPLIAATDPPPERSLIVWHVSVQSGFLRILPFFLTLTASYRSIRRQSVHVALGLFLFCFRSGILVSRVVPVRNILSPVDDRWSISQNIRIPSVYRHGHFKRGRILLHFSASKNRHGLKTLKGIGEKVFSAENTLQECLKYQNVSEYI